MTYVTEIWHKVKLKTAANSTPLFYNMWCYEQTTQSRLQTVETSLMFI